MISYLISYIYHRLLILTVCASLPLQLSIFSAQHSDHVSDAGNGDQDLDQEMDPDEARDYADQDPLPDSVMQQAGVPILYDSASNQRLPCLYIFPVANVVGRAPLIQCSSEATVTPGFHTSSRMICFLEAPLPTRSGTGATAAGSTR